MINNDLNMQIKSGADRIKSYCAMYLFNLGINLDFIDWSTNILSDTKEHILVMSNDYRNIELKFKTNELVSYSRDRGIRKTELKIRQYIHTIF